MSKANRNTQAPVATPVLQQTVSASPAAPKNLSKHARLLAALITPSTPAQLMQASNFDAKNLSVALCNLKRAGHVIKCVVTTVNNQSVRQYSLQQPAQ
jgi:hypothetical protein